MPDNKGQSTRRPSLWPWKLSLLFTLLITAAGCAPPLVLMIPEEFDVPPLKEDLVRSLGEGRGSVKVLASPGGQEAQFSVCRSGRSFPATKDPLSCRTVEFQQESLWQAIDRLAGEVLAEKSGAVMRVLVDRNRAAPARDWWASLGTDGVRVQIDVPRENEVTERFLDRVLSSLEEAPAVEMLVIVMGVDGPGALRQIREQEITTPAGIELFLPASGKRLIEAGLPVDVVLAYDFSVISASLSRKGENWPEIYVPITLFRY